MAYYAKLNSDRIVEQVVAISNEDEPTEAAGIEYCRNLFKGGNWIKTSYNATIRKNYAGIGYRYDHIRDAFIPPKPYASWLFDEATCRWKPPIEMPTDGLYIWDEITTSWYKIA